MDNSHKKYYQHCNCLNCGHIGRWWKYPGKQRKQNEELLKMADELLYILPTKMKRKITYFALVTWSDLTTSTGWHWRVHWRGNYPEEGQEWSGWQISKNEREWDTKTLWDWLKIGSHGGSWQPTFFKKTAPDDDDDDWPVSPAMLLFSRKRVFRCRSLELLSVAAGSSLSLWHSLVFAETLRSVCQP